MKSSMRDFDCLLLDGSREIVNACALGNLLKGDDSTIVVGDYVEIEDGKIIKVEERSNEIFRLIVREQKKKVSASNIDVMVILVSVSKPEYKRGIVDRFLVRAHQWNIHPVVVFNKMDQFEESAFDLKFEVDRLQNLNIECFEISAKDANYQNRFSHLGLKGLSDLKSKLEKSTAIFLGQSGVGKSKTISLLTEGKVELLSREVGKVGKGTHTTTWSELIISDHFTLIDSPGIRSFGLEDLLIEDLLSYHPDLEVVATRCKFRNCEHSPDSKGCAFVSMWNSEDYNDQLILSRLESYLRLVEEISRTPTYLKK